MKVSCLTEGRATGSGLDGGSSWWHAWLNGVRVPKCPRQLDMSSFIIPGSCSSNALKVITVRPASRSPACTLQSTLQALVVFSLFWLWALKAPDPEHDHGRHCGLLRITNRFTGYHAVNLFDNYWTRLCNVWLLTWILKIDVSHQICALDLPPPVGQVECVGARICDSTRRFLRQ